MPSSGRIATPVPEAPELPIDAGASTIPFSVKTCKPETAPRRSGRICGMFGRVRRKHQAGRRAPGRASYALAPPGAARAALCVRGSGSRPAPQAAAASRRAALHSQVSFPGQFAFCRGREIPTGPAGTGLPRPSAYWPGTLAEGRVPEGASQAERTSGGVKPSRAPRLPNETPLPIGNARELQPVSGLRCAFVVCP